jgi:murein L,D-transpeptidase YafK
MHQRRKSQMQPDRPDHGQRIRIACLVALFCAPALVTATDYATGHGMAERVVVRKLERKLYLMKNDQVLRTMDIALGLQPEGDKFEEGDFRTPEGFYMLTERNSASDFFLSIRVSYPNVGDMRQARLSGVSPGGQIMIHGQPNEPSRSAEYYSETDWTNGCIAVSNSDMVDLWLMTGGNTPIQILP